MSSTNVMNEVSGSGDKRNPTAGVPVPWEDPVPLMYAVKKPFPVDEFPGIFRNYTKAVAEAMQVPVDMVAATQLGVLGAVMMGKYTPRCPGWGQPTNLYVLVILDPSERKSSVIDALCDPIYAWERNWNEAHREDFEQKEILELRLKQAKDRFVKDPSTEDEWKAARDAVEAFSGIHEKKIIFSDATPASVGPTLKQADERAILITDEGGVFDLAQGNRDVPASIDIYNKAYDGSPVRVKRISREGEMLSNPLLGMVLMAQPVVQEIILSNPKWRGNGFVGRFCFAQPETLMGHRKVRPESIDPDLQQQYQIRIWSLLDDPSINSTVAMTEDAIDLWYENSAALEKRLDRYNGDFVDSCGWYGKLEGKILRIAGILAVAGSDADQDEFNSGQVVITRDVLSGAIKIGDYFVSEYQAAFETGGRLDTVKDAQFLVRKIRDQFEKSGDTTFTKTDMHQKWNRFRLKETRDKTIALLEEHNYIRLKDQNKYEVNPAVICD